MILAYARLSRKEQAEGQTLDQQIDRLQAAGYDKIYIDLESGRFDRAQFNAMVAHAKAEARMGRKVTIRVVRGDRFARNTITSLRTLEELEALGVTVESLERGRMSIASAADWSVTAHEALNAELFSRYLSDNIRRGFDYKRKNGQPVSKPPWGYRFNETRTAFEPDPELWEHARALVDMFLAGASYREGIKYAAENCGKKWSFSGLRGWLHNPVLLGHTVYTKGGWTLTEAKRGDKRLSKGQDYLYNTHPALMTEAEQQAIWRRIEANAKRWGYARKGFIYSIVTSYCFCAACGHRLKVHGRTNYRYLGCRYPHCEERGVIRDLLVEAEIELELSQRATALAQLATAQEELVESAEAVALRSQIEQLRAMRESSKLISLTEAINEAEAQLAQLTAKPGDVNEGLVELVMAYSNPEAWDTCTVKEKQQVFLDLVERVELRRNKIERITLRV